MGIGGRKQMLPSAHKHESSIVRSRHKESTCKNEWMRTGPQSLGVRRQEFHMEGAG